MCFRPYCATLILDIPSPPNKRNTRFGLIHCLTLHLFISLFITLFLIHFFISLFIFSFLFGLSVNCCICTCTCKDPNVLVHMCKRFTPATDMRNELITYCTHKHMHVITGVDLPLATVIKGGQAGKQRHFPNMQYFIHEYFLYFKSLQVIS